MLIGMRETSQATEAEMWFATQLFAQLVGTLAVAGRSWSKGNTAAVRCPADSQVLKVLFPAILSNVKAAAL